VTWPGARSGAAGDRGHAPRGLPASGGPGAAL